MRKKLATAFANIASRAVERVLPLDIDLSLKSTDLIPDGTIGRGRR